MAFYRPLQRTDGRWDYVCTNGAGTFPIGYCHEYRELKAEGVLAGFPKVHLDRENAEMAQHKDKYHGDGHATAEEAEACFKTFQLDQRLHLDGHQEDAQHKCLVCGEWTQGFAYLHGADVIQREWKLCEAHRTRESVEKLWDEGRRAR